MVLWVGYSLLVVRLWWYLYILLIRDFALHEYCGCLGSIVRSASRPAGPWPLSTPCCLVFCVSSFGPAPRLGHFSLLTLISVDICFHIFTHISTSMPPCLWLNTQNVESTWTQVQPHSRMYSQTICSSCGVLDHKKPKYDNFFLNTQIKIIQATGRFNLKIILIVPKGWYLIENDTGFSWKKITVFKGHHFWNILFC